MAGFSLFFSHMELSRISTILRRKTPLKAPFSEQNNLWPIFWHLVLQSQNTTFSQGSPAIPLSMKAYCASRKLNSQAPSRARAVSPSFLSHQTFRFSIGFAANSDRSEPLETQQRYFPYRRILVAIVSQKYFVLVFMRCRTIIGRYVVK